MASKSLHRFHELLGYVDQLIDIHDRLQEGRGRRYRQEALHRSGVVLVVAAWEGYVENALKEAVDLIEASIGEGTTHPLALPAVKAVKQFKKLVTADVDQFHTPSPENTVCLYKRSLGIDPSDYWIWRHPRRQWDKGESMKVMNEWLKIRHSIVHGASLPENIDWLKGPSGQPRLILGLLADCKKTFEHFAAKTDKALGSFLGSNYGISETW